jgi:hypothetical protein
VDTAEQPQHNQNDKDQTDDAAETGQAVASVGVLSVQRQLVSAWAQ